LASHMESLEKQLAASANVVRSPDKRCKNCQRVGHLAEECFRKGGGKEGQYPPWWKGRKDTNLGTSTANTVAITPDVVPEVGELTQYYGLAAISEEGGGNEIYADTGASDHFFRERADFITYH
ncbi:hypothetical protein F5050DRAFT_1535708, partial [Lentinula boryana]